MRKLGKWLMRIADIGIISGVACGYLFCKQEMPVRDLAILYILPSHT